MKGLVGGLGAALLFATSLSAQETRGTINGRVYDGQSAAIAGADVIVVQVGTNSTTRLTTNQSGYFEAPLLIPGAYRVTASAPGFKTTVRGGINLQIGQTVSADLKLDLGTVAETVVVTAESPVLDTNPLDSGTVIANEEVMELPVLGNNPTLLAKFVVGMQTDGVNNYLGLHS